MKPYCCEEIARLAHELTMSPLRLRPSQLAGLARAVDLIDPQREYPYSFVCFHVTGYRPRRPDDVLLSGKDVIADLAALADALTSAVPLPHDPVQDRHDPDRLAARFKVSTKTITRWRARGLIGLWFASADGRPRLAFPTWAVERFVCRNRDLVRRGASFNLMTQDEKRAIITRARELVATEQCSLHVVTTRLAEETGRAVETIRYTLRRYDRENPDSALFDRVEQPQPIDLNRVIFDAYAAGDPVAEIADRFGKRPADIRRIVTQVRSGDLLDGPIDYVYSEEFDAPGAEAVICTDWTPANDDDSDHDLLLNRAPADVPAYLAELYRTPLLSRGEERHLFRRMNYLRHRAELLRQSLAAAKPHRVPDLIADIDRRLDQARDIKNRIVQANLRLVVSIAKRHLGRSRADGLFERVSDGNVALMRAADKFDYARGFRFSTYASWAVTRHFARTIPEEIQQRDRYQTGRDEVLTLAPAAVPDEQPAGVESVRRALVGALKLLDDRERGIVERHFGLTNGGAGQTLDEIGRAFGISKERVRQLEQRALGKLRAALGDCGIELLAG